MISDLGELERDVLDRVAAQRQLTRAAAASLSIAGRGGTVWIVITALLAARRGKTRRAGVAGAAAWITADGAAHLFKRVTDRARPEPRVSASGPNPATSSMPSSHAAASAAFAAAAGTVDARLVAPLGLLAAGVAWSRLARERHFPSDVAAGALLGLGIGATCGSWTRRVPG